MRKTWRRIASVILALAMVVLALPEYVSPVKKAKAAATKRTVYVLTNSITKGEYLFVDRNSRGNGTAMASNGTSITTTTVNVQINQDAAIADIGVPYIDADVEGFPESAVWTAAVEDENMRVKKDDKYYLQFSEANVGGNNHQLVLSESTVSENSKYGQFSWRCDSNKLHVEYHNNNNGHDGDRYVYYNNSRYTAVTNNNQGSNQGNVYVYVKKVICAHDEYTCSFDWDMKWLMGEYKVSAIATFTCTGCGKAVSVVDATVSCSETTGTCAQKPQWTYTAKAKDPKGTEWTDTKDPMNQITEDTDPDAQITGTVYVFTNTVQTGKKYLIVDANSAGAAHALANGFPAPYNNDFDVKSREVTIKTETLKIGSPDSYEETESVYIEAAPSDAVWLCSAANPPYVSRPSNITNDLYFSNGDYFLTHHAGSSVPNPRIYLGELNTSENRYATWNINMVNNLRYSGGSNDYYVGYDNNNGWQGLSTNSYRSVYYFVETTITMNGFKEVDGGTHQFPLTHVSRVESGCEHAGNEEYWKCERCQTLFSDENGENETTAEAVVIPAAHDWQFDHFEWTQDSKNGYVSATAIYKCSRESTHTVEVTAPTVTDSELEMTEGSDADTFTAYVSATDSPDGREHGEDKTLAKYAVSFQLADGSAYGNPVYYYEGTIAADIDVPEDPEIEPDESYIYHFNGWKDGENGIHDVDGTVVYKATYTTEDVLYSVTWIVNGNETPEEDAYKHGDTPVYPGAQEPIMTPSAEFEYTFTGWSDGASEFPKSQDLPAIDNKDVTYTAVFESSKRSYTVEFIVEEKVVQTGAVEYGTSPSFTGETPTKTAEGNVVYTFKGWKLSGSDTVYGPTDTLPTVDENGATYTAVFEETTLYDINIDDAQNGTIRTDRTNNKAEAGETVTLTFEPAEGGYSLFSYWVEGPDGEITCDTTSGITFTMPAGAVAVHAVFGKYFPVWIAGTQITTVNQDNVLGDAAGSERITFSETTDKYVLTILTGDEITLNNNADVWNSLQKALIYIAETAEKPLEIVASKGLTLSSDTAYHGIYNESEYDLTVNGNVSIKLTSEVEGGQELNGIYCCYSAMTITGDVTLNFPNGKYGNGNGLFTTEGKNITITGDVDITGAGSSAIQCGNDLTVKGDKFSIEGLGDSDDLNYIYGVCAEGDVLIDCKTDGVSVYGVDYAITSVGKVKIIGDVDAVGKNDNAIDSGDKVTIEGNVLLGSGCNGIYAKSIDITGDVSMSNNHKFMSIGGCLLYSFEGDIKVDGSIKADCPEGHLLYARGLSEGAGKITVTNDITGLEGDAAETADGISAWAGITINGNVDMQVTNEGPVIGDVADNAKHYGINAGIGDLAIDGTLKLICADTVDYGLFVLNGETGNGTVTLGDEVSITMGGSGYGIYATGTITLPEARTEISTNDGIAIYTPCIRENDIVIPDGYGISTPEDGEVKVIADTAEDAMYDDCYTIVDPASPDVAASVVVIEPYIEVQFVNADEDQTVLATTKGFVGKAPKYTGETPTKKETDAETYTFDGWSYGEATYASGDLPTITEDMTGPIIFTAAYLVETKQYEVTFYDEDGKTVLLETATYDYGTKPKDITTPEKTPTKKDDDQYTYEFEGWDPELAEVTKNAAYTAKYKKVLKEFTIKFVNEDGKELQSTKVAYGTTPTYTGATPTKAADSQYTYTFKEWSPEIVTVTGEATYKATYDKKEISADDPVEEKGEYQLIGDKKISYKQKSGAVIKAQIKCTLHDENTFSKHKDVKSSKRTLVEGVDYKKTKGSVIIEFLPEYLDSLEVGSTMITVSFEDGNDVEIELEILPADAEEQKESPKTDDSMVFAWIIFLIGAASFSFMLIAKKREREERVGL